MTQTLPNDIARCDGYWSQTSTGFGSMTVGKAACANCLRRTAPRPENVWLMLPEIVDGQCKNRLISDHKGS